MTLSRQFRFSQGMGPHGGQDGEDAVVSERQRFVARTDRPDLFCSTCTGYVGATGVCRHC